MPGATGLSVGEQQGETARRPETSQEELAPTAGHGAQDSRAVLRREERRRCHGSARRKEGLSPSLAPAPFRPSVHCVVSATVRFPGSTDADAQDAGGTSGTKPATHLPAVQGARAQGAAAAHRQAKAVRPAPGLCLCPREQWRLAPPEEGAPGRGPSLRPGLACSAAGGRHRNRRRAGVEARRRPRGAGGRTPPGALPGAPSVCSL